MPRGRSRAARALMMKLPWRLESTKKREVFLKPMSGNYVIALFFDDHMINGWH